MAKARAVVQVGDRHFEMQSFELPKIGAEDALLEIEACGICGSDVDQYDGKINGLLRLPMIPGHEPLGVIEEIGAEASRRWGVAAGDRVAIEPLLGCGHCRNCMTGNFRQCRVGPFGTGVGVHGFFPTHTVPALRGGMAEYMYLDSNVALHKVSRDIPANLAVLFQPIAAGIGWAHREPGTRVGDTVVIFGAGQRGLACVVAAREAGAAQVMIVARRQSVHRLKLAEELGADATIFSDEDVVARVRELTHGEGADVVVETTSQATDPVVKAIEIAKPGGTVVLAGVKGTGVGIPGLEHDRIFMKRLTIKGVANADFKSFEIAVQLIESGKYPLEKMCTHSFALADIDRAIRTLAGRVPGENAVCVSLDPLL